MKKFIAITVVFTMLLFITACTAQNANLLEDEDFTVYVSDETSIAEIESDTSSEDESVIESEASKPTYSKADSSSTPIPSIISKKSSLVSKPNKSKGTSKVQKKVNNLPRINSPQRDPASYTTAEFLAWFGLVEEDIKLNSVKPGKVYVTPEEAEISDFVLSSTGGRIEWEAKNLSFNQWYKWIEKIYEALKEVAIDNKVFIEDYEGVRQEFKPTHYKGKTGRNKGNAEIHYYQSKKRFEKDKEVDFRLEYKSQFKLEAETYDDEGNYLGNVFFENVMMFFTYEGNNKYSIILTF